MALNLKLDVDTGQWTIATKGMEKTIATALTKAMRNAANAAVAAGRGRMAAAGFDNTWQKSLVSSKSAFLPHSGVSLDPSAWIHTRINYADVFEKGTTIHAGPHLIWIPLWGRPPPFAGSGLKFGGVVNRAHMTPSQYVRNVGPLITLRRPGKVPLLAAVVFGQRPIKAPKSGRFTKARLKKAASAQGDRQLIPLYFGVDAAKISPRFDVTGAVEAVGRQLGEFYLAVLKDMGLE